MAMAQTAKRAADLVATSFSSSAIPSSASMDPRVAGASHPSHGTPHVHYVAGSSQQRTAAGEHCFSSTQYHYRRPSMQSRSHYQPPPPPPPHHPSTYTSHPGMPPSSAFARPRSLASPPYVDPHYYHAGYRVPATPEPILASRSNPSAGHIASLHHHHPAYQYHQQQRLQHRQQHRAAVTRPAYFTWTPNTQRWSNAKSHMFRACANCRKGHVACDVNRPCRRCVLGGKADTCVDVDHRRRGRRNADEERAAKTVKSQSPSTAQPPPTPKPARQSRSRSPTTPQPGTHRAAATTTNATHHQQPTTSSAVGHTISPPPVEPSRSETPSGFVAMSHSNSLPPPSAAPYHPASASATSPAHSGRPDYFDTTGRAHGQPGPAYSPSGNSGVHLPPPPPHHAYAGPPHSGPGGAPAAAASGPVDLPPMLEMPPLPNTSKLPPMSGDFGAPASVSASSSSSPSHSGPPRPSLPPLSSLTGIASTGSGPAPVGPGMSSSAMPPTPSQSSGRDYFPPVPGAGAASQPLPANAAASAHSPTTGTPLTTMVLLLTFMDLRVARASDESLSMLGHHPMQMASKSLSELLHRTDRPKLGVLREWLRWVVCSASGLSDAHLTRFPGNVTAPAFQREPEELTAPAQDWPAHIIIEDSVHLRVVDGEYRQFRIRFYVGGPGVLVGRAETWENACVVCEVRQHGVPSGAPVSPSVTATAPMATSASPASTTTLPGSAMPHDAAAPVVASVGSDHA
ncbi:hypothetical protein THASP1DRAFT_28709 [Thamnocephalis sphaerospora]|uniref:Zn(2)-C6 fungal-type domain-containing protein n=1 Tax=Thamnocephalis sphaerospora TaxID=78915 RepID=A0A4P9XTK5_9FUNG|nr:hypothetical protein THASP1DRAFT_28709 [Thamnocephalis sphaerospora]|eukprot:RKP09505.1 hypothetical protein THASP1DRAFT_28709 [Thamnocephalis sphaerospora]